MNVTKSHDQYDSIKHVLPWYRWPLPNCFWAGIDPKCQWNFQFKHSSQKLRILFESLNRPKLLVEFFKSNNPVRRYLFMLPCQWPLWFRLTCATLRPVVIANLFVSLNRPKLSVEFFKSNTAVKSYKFMLPCQWPLWFRLTCAALRLLVETVN